MESIGLVIFCLAIASYFAGRILDKPKRAEEPKPIPSSWTWPEGATVGERPYDWSERSGVPII